jgi:hypothetical protein
MSLKGGAYRIYGQYPGLAVAYSCRRTRTRTSSAPKMHHIFTCRCAKRIFNIHFTCQLQYYSYTKAVPLQVAVGPPPFLPTRTLRRAYAPGLIWLISCVHSFMASASSSCSVNPESIAATYHKQTTISRKSHSCIFLTGSVRLCPSGVSECTLSRQTQQN